ncbi:MAG: response regulator [Phycisphaerae bacterium]|nr:response regulator [Phycisphaerae bacterium]
MERPEAIKPLVVTFLVVGAADVVATLGWAALPGWRPSGVPVLMSAVTMGLAACLAGWWCMQAARRSLGPRIEALRIERGALEAERAGLERALREREVEDARERERASFLARLSDVEHLGEVAEAVMDAIAAEAAPAPPPRCAVLVYQDDGVCRFAGARGLSEGYQRAIEGPCPWREGEKNVAPLVVEDTRSDASVALFRDLVLAEGILSFACIPLCTERGVVGKVMVYGGRPGEITPDQVESAHRVAASAGVAVGRILATRRMERMAAILQSTGALAHVGGWELEVGSSIVTWSPEVYRIHEVDPSERITLQRALSFYAPDGRAEIERAVAEGIQRGTGWDLELPLVTATGRRLWVRAQGEAERRDGRLVRLRGAFQDVTERRATQERMGRTLRDLVAARNESRRQAAELAARASEMEALRNAAEAANRSKSEFLANMSHEIRTPLTAILGYADLLREEELATPARREELIQTIRSAGQHLLTIINDILDLSKIEAERMTLEAVETSTGDLLAELDRLMRPRAQAKNVALDIRLDEPIPERVILDPTRLRQILLNLVGNATKFTAAGSVTVCVGLAPPAAGGPALRALTVTVEDTGPGISDAQQRKLFESFSQADATVTRQYGGTGLGLIICRRLARLMGGDVTLEWTRVGFGSCFRLAVPFAPVAGAGVIAAVPSRPAAEQASASRIELRGRVLYAEDGPDNQRLIALHLRRAGATLDVADDGQAALELEERARREGRPYDLILTDMQMPRMDGYTLARTLRGRGVRTPIIALTAHAMAEDRSRCLACGCDDYASKPIDKQALLGLCHAWLERGREGAGLARAA